MAKPKKIIPGPTGFGLYAPADRRAGAAGPKIPPPPPPPPTGQKGSTQAAYNAYINAHPTMRQYADTIQKWANVYGIDPVVAASLFWRESFAAAGKTANPATIVSSAGAVGIGQIMPLHVGGAAPWGTLSTGDLTNPAKNIQWSMWFFAQKVAAFGSYDAAYTKGYNPGYTGPSLIPKGYVPKSGLSPADQGVVSAEQSAATAAAKQQITDRWVVRNPNGTLGFQKITDASKPPKNVVMAGGLMAKGKTLGGVPLTVSNFVQAKQTYDNYFITYLGRSATNREVAALLEHPQSEYQLAQSLSKKPGFLKSQLWKAHANGIIGLAQSLYGQNWKPKTPADQDFIRRAIVENWDQATLETKLRARPEYLKGPEFKDTVSKFTTTFMQIYGIPGQNAQKIINEAAASGWSADEFASWLRAQPAYTTSEEYQQSALSFAQQLGMVVGKIPTLTPGTPFPNPNPSAGPGPNSTRIPGRPAPLAPRTVSGSPLTVGTVGGGPL